MGRVLNENFLSGLMLFPKYSIKNQVFWAFRHVPVISTDYMTTDLEHCLSILVFFR